MGTTKIDNSSFFVIFFLLCNSLDLPAAVSLEFSKLGKGIREIGFFSQGAAIGYFQGGAMGALAFFFYKGTFFLL